MPQTDAYPTFTVLGAGAWGSALAIHLARSGQIVHLWDRDAKHIQQMQETGNNAAYLPACSLPPPIKLFSDLAESLQSIQNILLVIPSHAFREILLKIKPYIVQTTRIVWATKGIDVSSNKLFHEVVQEILGERHIATLSGPSFAAEVAQGLPTAVTIAANNHEFAQQLAERFSYKNMRAYVADDLIGVQLGGAVKNVIAIAVGIADGLGFGANARCALITRGLAEMVRLGIAMGAKQQTFMGLSGVGDLILTCTDNQSRNRRLGLAIGQGQTIKAAQETVGKVVEGYQTVPQVVKLAKQYQIDMPITEQVWQILYHHLSPTQAVQNLLLREAKSEMR